MCQLCAKMFHEQTICLQRCAVGTISNSMRKPCCTCIMNIFALFHYCRCDEAYYLLYSIEQSTEEYAGIVPSSMGSFVDNKFIRILSELGSLHPFQLQEYQMVRVGGQIWYSREIHSTLFVVLIPGFNLRWCTKNYNPKVCGDKISTSKTFGVCKGFAKVGRSALANEIGVSVQKIKQIVNLPYGTFFGHFQGAHFVVKAN